MSKIGKNEVDAFEREKRKLTKRLNELDRLFTALYEDKVMENITQRNYELMSGKYEKEQIEIDNRLRDIEADLIAKGKNDKGVEDFISLIQNYKGITELTANIVNSLIDRITVSERVKQEDGSIEQHIKIFYKFIGSLNDSQVHISEKPTPVTIQKTCILCGSSFDTNGYSAKYCPDCRKVKDKEYQIKAGEKRMIQRGGRHLLPKACECCGEEFTPKSHNARYCEKCTQDAKKKS